MPKILVIDFIPQEIIHDVYITQNRLAKYKSHISSMNLEDYLGLPTGLLL